MRRRGTDPGAPGYHEAVRDLCTRYGTLLLIDETHTISAGPGGCTKAWGLHPDIVTIAKGLGAGYQPIGATVAAATAFGLVSVIVIVDATPVPTVEALNDLVAVSGIVFSFCSGGTY